jgi:hypothetical protein
MVVLAGGAASGQQTLFNHPSVDVLDQGWVYFELDAVHRPRRGFEGLTARAAWGLASPVEVGLNVGPLWGTGIAGAMTATPNAKVTLFSQGAAERLVAVAGSRAYLALSPGAVTLEGYALLGFQSPTGAPRGCRSSHVTCHLPLPERSPHPLDE